MKQQQPSVAVVGLGFIGLPLSLSYAMHGVRVVGVDVLPELVAQINAGTTTHLEYYNGRSIQDILREQIAAGRFSATTDYEEACAAVDHYIITVGVPVVQGQPNMEYLRSCCESLAKVLKQGDTIVIRSTVVPGTTEEVLIPLLEQSGLRAGVDFYLAYSSERVAEGRAFEEFISMPLALGGINEISVEKGRELLSLVTKAEIVISDIKTVETAKVIENIQRDVNIAMVQQFARFAEKLGIDTFDMIKVANSHTRVNLLTPGPGVGGFCLPNALYYLLPKAEELGLSMDLLTLARNINDGVPEALVDMMEEALQRQGKTLRDSKIALLGLAMKDFSNDDRISPPHTVAELLIARGAQVSAYDPAVKGEYDYKVDTLEAAVGQADGLIYLAVQEEFLTIDWVSLVNSMGEQPVLLDTKNRIPRHINATSEVIRI